MNLAIVLMFAAYAIRYVRDVAPGSSAVGLVVEGVILLLALIAIAWAFGMHP